MKFTETCVKAVQSYVDAVKACDDERFRLEKEFKDGNLAPAFFNEKVAKVRQRARDERHAMWAKINNARDSYVNNLSTRYVRSAETIDMTDLNLLESSVASLTEADVLAMFEKHGGNLGMQGIIAEANARREKPATLVYYDKETRARAAEVFADEMKNAAEVGGVRQGFALAGKYITPALVGE